MADGSEAPRPQQLHPHQPKNPIALYQGATGSAKIINPVRCRRLKECALH
jgi:hypothetical protein